jgi:3-phosphoshikimate 1-carboxyvinyltransferase
LTGLTLTTAATGAGAARIFRGMALAIITSKVSNGRLEGTVKVPQSKSLLHRYLILSGLSKYHPLIVCTNNSDDIMATKRCLVDLGLIEKESAPVHEDGIYRLDCGESGSTYKFLMPIVSTFNKTCRYRLGGKLVYNPLEGFYRVLRSHGVRREVLRADEVEVSGQLTAGTFILPGYTDAQSISGLLMALPLLEENSTVMVEKKIQSEAYVNMTIELMRAAGVKVNVIGNQSKFSRVYKVEGSQHYSVSVDTDIEGDWSLAAYWLVGAAISGGRVTCTNMDVESLQGDRYILNILDAFGANLRIKWHEEPDGWSGGRDIFWTDITVEGGDLYGIMLDGEDIPDLIPQVVLLACAAEGTTVIKNVGSLRLGESGRIKNIVKVINNLGGRIYESNNCLIIEGNGADGLVGGIVRAHNDHRIAMMAAVAAGICSDEVIIEGADAVSKSYPDFFEVLEGMKT